MPNPHLDFAGDYNLGSIILINAFGDRLPLAMGIVAELNVYEDIYSNAVRGTMHMFDSNNIISNAKLHGNERLEFRLSTPGVSSKRVDTVDASEKTGYPKEVPGQASEAYSAGLAEFVSHIRDRGGVDLTDDVIRSSIVVTEGQKNPAIFQGEDPIKQSFANRPDRGDQQHGLG